MTNILNDRNVNQASGWLKTLSVGAMACMLASCQNAELKQKPNVLFIVVDDLRPELGCYNKVIQSPNIDKLAQSGVVFGRAYCNVPVCGASRASLLTGTRPGVKRFLHYDTSAEKDNPHAITLPALFKQNGYYTIARSKVFGFPGDSEKSWDELWSPIDTAFYWRDYALPENIRIDSLGGFDKGSYPYECAAVDDSAYFDGKAIRRAIKDLNALKQRNQPFFLAVGLRKPHLPFNAPKKYWDLYQREQFKLPANYKSGQPDIPAKAFHNSAELRAYHGVPAQGLLSDSLAITLIHGYYAAVSFSDHLIGELLNELDRLELSENTIVVLIGDNGWNLGDHGMWCKHCNFNTSLHTPLIVRAPRISGGKKTTAITEFIDIYPSLCELAGIDKPNTLEGISFVPVLNNPRTSVKDFAVCKWADGTTLIDGNYFYTEWRTASDSVYRRMLFDHAADPDENINLAKDPANTNLMEQLSAKLVKNRGAGFLN